jgi:hypothetical protein
VDCAAAGGGGVSGSILAMAKPFVSPKLHVADQFQQGSDVVTVLFGSLNPYTPPLVPAALYDVATERREIFQLHKILYSSEESSRFITFGSSLPVESIIGNKFVYRPWWSAEAWDLVTNPSLTWHRESYPDNGNHTHCPITWQAISAYKEPREGYKCGKVWITIEAYEKFIRDDIYNCRG